jgi:hypothetical protein
VTLRRARLKFRLAWGQVLCGGLRPDDGMNEKRRLESRLCEVAKGGIEPPSAAADVVRRGGYVPDDGMNEKRRLESRLCEVAKGGIEPPSAAADMCPTMVVIEKGS